MSFWNITPQWYLLIVLPLSLSVIFKRIFFNENVWISNKISLKFIHKGPINNIPALVQIMAWGRSGDKPLSEPMMVSFWRIYASLGLNELTWGIVTETKVCAFAYLLEFDVMADNIMFLHQCVFVYLSVKLSIDDICYCPSYVSNYTPHAH